MKETTDHRGRIAEIVDDSTVRVVIDKPKCDGCSLGSLCSIPTKVEDGISVKVTDTSKFTEGEQVNVVSSARLERRAIMLCFVVPCIMLLTAVAGIALVATPEMGCVGGIVALIIYFLFLYTKGRFMVNGISFKIEEI